MDSLLSLGSIQGGLPSIILLVGFLLGLFYKSKNFVNKDQVKLYVTHKELSEISNKYVKEEQHKKDIEHLTELFTTRIEGIANDIHEIKESLKSKE